MCKGEFPTTNSPTTLKYENRFAIVSKQTIYYANYEWNIISYATKVGCFLLHIPTTLGNFTLQFLSN